MENEVLFAEKQKFKQWWLWLILLVINAIFISGIYQQVLCGKQFGDKPMSNAGILIVFSLVLLITLLFLFFKLETVIKNDGIYVRFFPVQFAYRKYTWDKIAKAFVRQYNPITEYGGWGLRYGIFGKGKALNVYGDKGLQIIFADTTKLLIGTNKPDELTEVLCKIDTLK